MTIDEACVEIVAETKTRTWNECNDTLRALVVKTIFEQFLGPNWEAEPEQAAKKIKQRKPRKAKTVPLTQHAGLGAGLEGNE